jgi:hypothetical protein
MNKIIFEKTNTMGEMSDFIEPPAPSSTFIPEWYKNMPLYLPGENKPGLATNSNKASNLTMKGCTPFLDALTHGYMYYLSADIEVRKNSEGVVFRWRPEGNLLTEHTPDQHPGLPSPVGGDNFVLKWSFPFSITTPKGYSCFFTHPLNRDDLPFRTLSGVVDTDNYHLPVQFPFHYISNEEGVTIIKKGTPLCQIIPFKRDEWKLEVKEFNKNTHEKRRFEHSRQIIRSYKTQYWDRKKFT